MDAPLEGCQGTSPNNRSFQMNVNVKYMLMYFTPLKLGNDIKEVLWSSAHPEGGGHPHADDDGTDPPDSSQSTEGSVLHPDAAAGKEKTTPHEDGLCLGKFVIFFLVGLQFMLDTKPLMILGEISAPITA